MSTYIKGGIVTKITILDKNAFQENKLKEYFDLNLYTKDKNNYYLKEYILNKSIKSYREEILKLTNSKADSIENSEAYILNTNANTLLKEKIILTNNHEKYFFENYKKMAFETDSKTENIEDLNIIIHMIPIIWSTEKISAESINFFCIFINNLIKKSLNNKLKDCSWFTIMT